MACGTLCTVNMHDLHGIATATLQHNTVNNGMVAITDTMLCIANRVRVGVPLYPNPNPNPNSYCCWSAMVAILCVASYSIAPCLHS